MTGTTDSRKDQKLGKHITAYFSYMLNERRCSPKTYSSYEEMFCLLLDYFENELGISPEKLKVSDLNYENVRGFYRWLMEKRGNSPSTRNQRQAALNSFCRYMLAEVPSVIGEYQKILDIPRAKTIESDPIFTSPDGIKAFLHAIPRDSKIGTRDYVMFNVAFSTGVRVTELVSIKVEDVHFEEDCWIRIVGKGKKVRLVPVSKIIAPLLKSYMQENNMLDKSAYGKPLFPSTHGGGFLTRQSVNQKVEKYVDKACKTSDGIIPEGFSPHSMRHSIAMALLDSDTELIYIRDLLGHASVVTTERYARASRKKKDEAISKVVNELFPEETGIWKSNKRLRDRLKEL